ncbi:AAA family ATPase [Angustibacter speluncae]
MILERLHVEPHLRPSDDHWPLSVPAVRQLADEGLRLHAPVTFLVGENGSGKSTIVEAAAECFDLDNQGGRANRKYASDRPPTALGEVLGVELGPEGHAWRRRTRLKRYGFFLRAETAFGLMNAVEGSPGYWEQHTSLMSHGEGFLTVFDAMLRSPGIYFFDEPEAALSFQSTLVLAARLHQLAEEGSQVVVATHSPVLSALPGADVVELGPHGLRRTAWEDLEVVGHWRSYLDDPARYLRHLLAD